MSTGLKRTFYPVKLFFPVIALLVVLALVYGSFFRSPNEVEANIASFYPTNCLGGWKNVDKIAGQPEVRPDNDVIYTDENSASTINSNAQVFCGGFSGEIPDAAKHQKVTVNFSWYIGDKDKQEKIKKENEAPVMEVISDSVAPATEVVADPAPETVVEPELPEVEVSPEPAIDSPVEETQTEPTAFNFYSNFFSVAHAQEEVPAEAVISKDIVVESEVEVPKTDTPVEEEVVQADAEPVVEVTQTEGLESVVESISSEGAYFEVLYTLNGQDWNSLGFVYRIANDIEIEMPIDLFATVEDLRKVQVALHTVERFDSVPEIYLDSLWLEVIYDDVDGGELAPPGSRPGDVIFSETIYQDEKAVVVLRNVELMTLSNVLSASVATSTASTTIYDSEVSTSTESTASTSDTNGTGLTDFVSTSTLASIINSTGVLVELWLYASTTDSWSRIADDSIISRNPQVKFEAGNVFWVDKTNTNVWRYNPRSGGYDALSLSVGQRSILEFRNEAGELKELEFSAASSTLMFEEIKTAKPLAI